MAAIVSNVSEQVLELSDDSFNTFCNDITDMLSVEMQCSRRQVVTGTVDELQKHFKKLAAVDIVKANGVLNGTFYILFDQRGLFTLSGVIVMLPAKRIFEETRQGSDKDAQSMRDAIGEAGNLLVGSWDRVFRDGMGGNSHFSKTDTFIGNPWDQPQQKIGLAANEELLFVIYDMTVSVYPSFTCGVAFPKALLSGGSEPVSEPGKPVVEITKAGPPAEASEQPTQSQREASQVSTPAAQSSGAVQEIKVAQVDVNASGTIRQDGAASETNVPEVSDGEAVLQPTLKVDVQSDLLQMLGRPVADIMQKDIVWASPDDSIKSVHAKMQQHNIGYIIVGSNGIPEGLVSNSNVLGAISPYLHPTFAKWRRPLDDASLDIKVKWIMSRPVRTVPADATVAAAIEHMRQFGGRCLPVVDGRGVVQGLVTAFDIIFKTFAGDGGLSQSCKTPQSPALFI